MKTKTHRDTDFWVEIGTYFLAFLYHGVTVNILAGVFHTFIIRWGNCFVNLRTDQKCHQGRSNV